MIKSLRLWLILTIERDIMTEILSFELGSVTETAVSSVDGIVSFYQLLCEHTSDPASDNCSFTYSCFIVTVADGNAETALVRRFAATEESARALFESLVLGAVTPCTVYDVIEDMKKAEPSSQTQLAVCRRDISRQDPRLPQTHLDSF